MGLHPADFFQRDSPFGQGRVVEKLRELIVRDRLDLGSHERARLAYLCEKILKLAHAREVIGVRAVLGDLERGEMIEVLDFQIECLLEIE